MNRPCVCCKKSGIHHRSLCLNHFPSGDAPVQPSSKTSENQAVAQSTQRTSEGAVLAPYTGDKQEVVGDTTSCLTADELVLMQTASVKLQNLSHNRSTQARLLFDCGSQRTYITQQTSHKLDLVITKTEKLSMCTFGSKTTTDLITGTLEILMLLKDGTLFKMKVNIVPRISGTISRMAVSAGKLKKVVNVFDLADSIPHEEESFTIDILLGNGYYLDLVMCTGEQTKEISPGLYLIPSKLGWILTGRLECDILDSHLLSMLTYTTGPVAAAIHPSQILNHIDNDRSMIKDLWKLDSIEIKEPIILQVQLLLPSTHLRY